MSGYRARVLLLKVIAAVIGLWVWGFGNIALASCGTTKSTDHVGEYVAQVTFTGSYESATNTLQAFYYDATTGQLRHAWTTGPSWSYECLDGDGLNTNDNVGEYITATTYAGSYLGATNTIQVFYYDVTAKALRHAWWSGSWHFEIIDGNGSSYSGAVPTHDVGQYVKAVTFYPGGVSPTIEVLYYDATTGQIRQATYNGSWALHGVMDATTDSVGQYIALTDYTANGTYALEALYYDATKHAVRQAWTTGSSWSFQLADGGGSGCHSSDNVGQGISMTQYSSALEAIYYDATKGALDHIWTTGASWSCETVDYNTSYNVGQFPAITGFGNYLEGFYYDSTSESIKQAATNGPPFSLSWLDGYGSSHSGYTTDQVGQYASATSYTPTGGSDTLEVLYYDASYNSLRHAFSTGSTWSFEWMDGNHP
jgi:hypothetical protein